MLASPHGMMSKLRKHFARARYWLFLRRRVSGRIKLRGDVRQITIHPSFRCDGDLWLGIHSLEGSIAIGPGVSASGPLIVTAVGPLRIGAGTLFGPNVLITDHYHGDTRDAAHRATPPSQRPLHSPGHIEIAEHVQFGANSVVLSPATVGKGAIVAANAVVKGIIPPMSVYAGLAISAKRCDASAVDHRG